MKDFVKWLGVNEKIAKVVVWLLIIMVTLIIFNTAMESMGFPYYAITYQNIIKINVNRLSEYIVSCIVVVLNFYAIALLVFRVKEIKNIFKYSVIYLILNIILALYLSDAAMQIFVISYMISFFYLYSKKKWKYILYGVLSIIVNMILQGITYLYKVRFIDYSNLNAVVRGVLSIDYFIIMAIIILVKEVYLIKRSEKNGKRTTNKPIMVGNIQQRRTTSKKTSKKSSKSS